MELLSLLLLLLLLLPLLSMSILPVWQEKNFRYASFSWRCGLTLLSNAAPKTVFIVF